MSGNETAAGAARPAADSAPSPAGAAAAPSTVATDSPGASPPRRYGYTSDELAAIDTAYRPGLLAGKRVLVAGGGSGMGRATAFLAARLGAEVAICGRNEAKLADVAGAIERLLGRKVRTRAMTIRDPAQVESLYEMLDAELGGVEVLVNSAGGQFPQNAIDYSVKGWNAVVDTNLNGTFWMMQAAARRWRDRGEPGAVVNIIATFERGIPQSAHTAAARAGVAYLTRSVAVEWAPHRIRVNCIAPGNTETEGLANYSPEHVARMPRANPMQVTGDAWDIAQAVVYLAGPTGKWITGETLHVNGGSHLWGTNWPLGVPPHFQGQG